MPAIRTISPAFGDRRRRADVFLSGTAVADADRWFSRVLTMGVIRLFSSRAASRCGTEELADTLEGRVSRKHVSQAVLLFKASIAAASPDKSRPLRQGGVEAAAYHAADALPGGPWHFVRRQTVGGMYISGYNSKKILGSERSADKRQQIFARVKFPYVESPFIAVSACISAMLRGFVTRCLPSYFQWTDVVTQTKLVVLGDDCTVTHINHSHRTLVEAFASQGPIVVDLAQVAAADVTLIQLILAAFKTAALQDRAFSLKSVPNRLQAVLGSSGISLNLESGQIIS